MSLVYYLVDKKMSKSMHRLTEEEVAALREAETQRERKNADFEAIIRPLRTASYEVDMEWHCFDRQIESIGADYGGLELEPDFQRGHVWTHAQQQHFIENVLRGVVTSAGFHVQFNCPNWDNVDYAGDLPRGLQCLDGLQRITAVRDFLAGKVKPFGLSVSDLAGSRFSPRRSYYRFSPSRSYYRFLRVSIHNFERKADLLAHYLDLNAGGTPHSAEDLERVRAMLAASI